MLAEPMPSSEERAAVEYYNVHILSAIFLIIYALSTWTVYLIWIPVFIVVYHFFHPIVMAGKYFWFSICYNIGGFLLILGVVMMQVGVQGYLYAAGLTIAVIGFSIMMILGMRQLWICYRFPVLTEPRPSLEKRAAVAFYIMHILSAIFLIIYALFTRNFNLISISGYVAVYTAAEAFNLHVSRRVNFLFSILYNIGGILLILGVATMHVGVPVYLYASALTIAVIGFSIMMILGMRQLWICYRFLVANR